MIDLDLTTANRSFRAGTASRHKRLNDLDAAQSTNKKQKKGKSDEQTGQAANGVDGSAAGQENVPSPVVEEIPEDGLHILDFHTNNPIVSYRGQVYSCEWVDTIGTTMFFSKPGEIPLYDADIQTKDFDMVGLTRIKLVGRQTKITPIETSKDQSAGKGVTVVENPGHSLGTIKRGNAKLNSDLRKQANFLEQLMNIKKNRGELDNVHVVMNSKISQSIAEDKLKAITQRRGEQIDELNRKVVRGDAEALKKLEQIYSGRYPEESEEEEELEDNTPNVRPRQPRQRKAPNRMSDSPDEDTEDGTRPRVLGTASPSPPGVP